MENRQARTDFVGEAEQVKLHTQFAVIATLGLLEEFQVAVQRILGLPGGAINALQARVGLVAAPVGRGTARQLERWDVLGGGYVRATAQVPQTRSRVRGLRLS